MKQVSYDKLQRLSADSEEQAEAAKAQVCSYRPNLTSLFSTQGKIS